jgi:hypothetical protein
LRGSSESTVRELQKNGGDNKGGGKGDGAENQPWSCEYLGDSTIDTNDADWLWPDCGNGVPIAGKKGVYNANYDENDPTGEVCMACCECDCDTTEAPLCRTEKTVAEGDDCSAYGSQFVEYDGTGGDCESTCDDHCNPV